MEAPANAATQHHQVNTRSSYRATPGKHHEQQRITSSQTSGATTKQTVAIAAATAAAAAAAAVGAAIAAATDGLVHFPTLPCWRMCCHAWLEAGKGQHMRQHGKFENFRSQNPSN